MQVRMQNTKQKSVSIVPSSQSPAFRDPLTDCSLFHDLLLLHSLPPESAFHRSDREAERAAGKADRQQSLPEASLGRTWWGRKDAGGPTVCVHCQGALA